MFVVEAKYEHDVDNRLDCVKITCLRFVPGTMYNTHTHYVYTSPKGNWKHLEFTLEDDVKLYDFMKAMVKPNLDTARLIAREYHTEVLHTCHGDYDVVNSLVQHIRIVDPTFYPPQINPRARWQRDILDLIASETCVGVINTCTNEKRLTKYSDAMLGMLL